VLNVMRVTCRSHWVAGASRADLRHQNKHTLQTLYERTLLCVVSHRMPAITIAMAVPNGQLCCKSRQINAKVLFPKMNCMTSVTQLFNNHC
jgi:hypothetical protein